MGNIESRLDLDAVLTFFDDVSGTFDIIITYIIRHLVPSYTVAIQAKSVQQQFMHLDDDCTMLSSGSEAEGLCLKYARRNMQGDISEISDSDIMHIKPYHAAETLQKATEGKAMLYLDASETYPGYMRVKWVNPVENVYYTHQQVLTSNIKPKSEIGTYASNVKVSQTGPFTRVEHARLVVNPGNYQMTLLQSQDDIPALPLKGWPSFIRKPKKTGLFHTVYHQMMSKAENKCQFHLVPIAHPSSTDPDIEWRISCSYFELLLCQYLTTVQRQAYLAFKFLAKEATKEHKVIKTYHMKTTFFWVLETAPSDLWEDVKLARCLYALLDRFIGFLADRKLPHYFIPGNNLVGHLSDDQIKPALYRYFQKEFDVD